MDLEAKRKEKNIRNQGEAGGRRSLKRKNLNAFGVRSPRLIFVRQPCLDVHLRVFLFFWFYFVASIADNYACTLICSALAWVLYEHEEMREYLLTRITPSFHECVIFSALNVNFSNTRFRRTDAPPYVTSSTFAISIRCKDLERLNYSNVLRKMRNIISISHVRLL